MSHPDDPRSNPGPNSGHERGAYTPPTGDDDLPYMRGGFDARGSGRKAPPVTLIVSVLILLALVVAVALFYRSGLRASTDAPPAVGTVVADMTVEAAPEDQPVDPASDVSVYRDTQEPVDAEPVFAPPPEAVQPRPAAPAAPAHTPARPPVTPPAAPAPTQAPTQTQTAAPVAAAPAPAAPATGSSAVQIGAFSSTAIADREYAAVAARFGQFAAGAEKRVQQVTTASGSVVYRTQFAGLSRDRAVAFCNALKAAGRDCIVR